jgi:hypothetical protein
VVHKTPGDRHIRVALREAADRSSARPVKSNPTLLVYQPPTIEENPHESFNGARSILDRHEREVLDLH